MPSPLLGKGATFSSFPCLGDFLENRFALSAWSAFSRSRASPPWSAVTVVSPSRCQGPGRGTPSCGTGGPGGEQMSPALASHAHLPSWGQTPQEEGPVHTSLVHRTHSKVMPGVAGGHWEWAPRAEGASWDASPCSSSHPRRGHGGEGPGCRPFLLTSFLQSQKRWELASCSVSPKPVSAGSSPWRRPGSLRAVDKGCLCCRHLCGALQRS